MDVEKTMEFILEQMAHVTGQLAEISAFQARTDKRLDRAIHLGVQESLRERKRRRELDEKLAQRAAEADEKITELAAAQLVTEEKLQRLIDERRGINGKS